jgi:hypothetical protein
VNAGTKLTRAGAFNHLKTLADVVKSFEERYTAHSHDPVIEYVMTSPDLPEAIRRAVAAKRRNGKMFGMESCIKASSRQAFLVNVSTAGMVHRFNRYKTFEEVFDLVRSCMVPGIGELVVYNVSRRIGAYLRIEPKDFLYLHAGPLKGWKALTGQRGNPYRVSMKEVPAPLRVLTPHRLEDLLCEYREFLHPGLMP